MRENTRWNGAQQGCEPLSVNSWVGYLDLLSLLLSTAPYWAPCIPCMFSQLRGSDNRRSEKEPTAKN